MKKMSFFVPFDPVLVLYCVMTDFPLAPPSLPLKFWSEKKGKPIFWTEKLEFVRPFPPFFDNASPFFTSYSILLVVRCITRQYFPRKVPDPSVRKRAGKDPDFLAFPSPFFLSSSSRVLSLSGAKRSQKENQFSFESLTSGGKRRRGKVLYFWAGPLISRFATLFGHNSGWIAGSPTKQLAVSPWL